MKGKLPNSWGLYDMLGNVWEWCVDQWEPTYGEAPQLDPVHVAEAGSFRVIRGGSWGNTGHVVRAAWRNAGHFEIQDGYLGFRCLHSPELSQFAQRR